MANTKHGVLCERDNFIKNCINRAGIFTEDLDGGAFCVLDEVDPKDREVYKVKKWTKEKDGLYIVYNPSVKYDEINGKLFPASSLDDRDYTNVANKVFDMFRIDMDIVIGINKYNLDAELQEGGLVKGDYVKPKTNDKVYVKTSASGGKAVDPDVPCFLVEDVWEVSYPTGDFSEDKEKVYMIRRVQ